MKAPVKTTLALGLMAVIMLVSLENKHQGELVQVRQDGVAVGYKRGHSDLTESLSKKVTTEKCMSFWFSDSPTRVGEAIKKVKMQ